MKESVTITPKQFDDIVTDCAARLALSSAKEDKGDGFLKGAVLTGLAGMFLCTRVREQIFGKEEEE